MVLQEKNYIKKQKNKYLKGAIIWTILVIGVYATGMILIGSRASYFTVFAGVLVVGAALNITRFIGYGKFHDGDEAMAQILENMKGSYDIFHSAVIPDNRGTAYFEHIVITSRSIYLITYDEVKLKKFRLWLENKLASKGIPMKHIHIMAIKDSVAMKNLAIRIEKDACYTSNEQEEYTKIINSMLM